MRNVKKRCLAFLGAVIFSASSVMTAYPGIVYADESQEALTIPEEETSLKTDVALKEKEEEGIVQNSQQTETDVEEAQPNVKEIQPDVNEVKTDMKSLQAAVYSGGEQEWMTEDKAYIDQFAVTNIQDGTSPFDGTTGNGYDADGNNRQVRSYDDITYTLTYVTEAYDTEDSFVNGYLRLVMRLPYTEDEAYFDTASMNWMCTESGHEWTVTKDKNGHQTLTCTRKLEPSKGGETSIPGNGSMDVTVRVRGMKNGDKVEPSFYAYLDGNACTTSETEMCKEHNRAEYVKATGVEPVIITSRPGYNIQVRQISRDGAFASGKYDFSTGNAKALNKDAGIVEGRLIGYGITIQIYNTETNKGLKGLELPDGRDITFDLDFSDLQYRTTEPKEYNLDINKYTPLVWSYD